MCRAGIDASHDALFACDTLGIDHLQRCFDKLRERRAEKFFLPFVSCKRPDTGKQVAAFSESSLQRKVLVVASLAEAAVESVGICKFRDELVAEAKRYCRIFLHCLVEIGSGAQQFVVFQAKQRHLILRIARAFPIVVPAEVELHHLEKFRSVHHRRSEREARPRQLTLDKRDEMRCEQTRKRQLGLQPELIRIEVVATAIHLAYLPLISSVKLYSQPLATSEDIAVKHLK